jgi:hypothetical protein
MVCLELLARERNIPKQTNIFHVANRWLFSSISAILKEEKTQQKWMRIMEGPTANVQRI